MCDMSAIPCQSHVAPLWLYGCTTLLLLLPQTQKFAFAFEAVANAATQPTNQPTKRLQAIAIRSIKCLVLGQQSSALAKNIQLGRRTRALRPLN